MQNTVTSGKLYNERLKFYADTFREKNKYFCWKIDSILTLKETLWRFFDKGWKIRSAWYEKINTETKEVIENTRINLQREMDEWANECAKKHRKYFRK